MIFTKSLRAAVAQGRITCSLRFWTRPHVKVGNRYPMEHGFIEVDSIAPIDADDITAALARRSGFKSLDDMLKVARHGRSEQAFLVTFHYIAGEEPVTGMIEPADLFPSAPNRRRPAKKK